MHVLRHQREATLKTTFLCRQFRPTTAAGQVQVAKKMSQRCTFLHDAVRKRGERSSAAPVESTTVSPSLWP